jgi:hypothetical protein
MMKMTQQHPKKCLLGLMFGMLYWGTMTPAQAGPTKSRFDRSYPSISRIFESNSRVDSPAMLTKIADETVVERWFVDIPPWHTVGQNLRLPQKPGFAGVIVSLPESARRPAGTDRAWDEGDEDDEPNLTDYDYQEWLSASVAPDRDLTP